MNPGASSSAKPKAQASLSATASIEPDQLKVLRSPRDISLQFEPLAPQLVASARFTALLVQLPFAERK
jgi:hypothetical protein